jgi:hypothetical protein
MDRRYTPLTFVSPTTLVYEKLHPVFADVTRSSVSIRMVRTRITKTRAVMFTLGETRKPNTIQHLCLKKAFPHRRFVSWPGPDERAPSARHDATTFSYHSVNP